MPVDITLDDNSTTTYSAQAVTAKLKLNRKVIQVNAVQGTTGRSQAFTIQNVGNKAITLGTDAFTIGGPDAAYFSITGGSLPRRLAPDKRGQFFLALTPAANAPTNRVLTAYLDIKVSGGTSAIARITLRGLATTGEGADKEPSLARLMELFQYSIDVGDPTPNTTFLDLNGDPTDEVFAPRFEKASDAPVTVTTIAQFVPKTSTVAGRFGYYTPGLPSSRKQLLELAGADGQSVNPAVNGSTTFDPGTLPFSLWAEAPTFIDDNVGRIIYGEDALNTWETDEGNRRKVRVYGLVESGRAVENAYVVAFEEYQPQNDQNDYVFVIRNVTTSSNRPVLGLVSVDGIDDATVLAFNRIQNENTSIGNDVHDVSKVRVVNTGNKDLLISSISIGGTNAGDFVLVNPPAQPVTLKRNATLDLTVRFTAQFGDFRTAKLNINSNDKIKRTTQVTLNGFWQSHSEQNDQGISQEPSLAEIFQTLGYKTAATWSGQVIDGSGASEAIGDEVLSAYWRAADAAKPVAVKQLASFHNQGVTSEIAWYEQGSPFFFASDPRYPGASENGPRNTIFFSNMNDGQSLLQRKKDTTDPAEGSFSTNTVFGFRVDAEFSDDTLNNVVQGDSGSHHMRFYPVRDARGDYVPNQYLMTMDYSSINFDYNDNIYLISNIRPADRTAAVDGLSGYAGENDIVLDWADVPSAASYLVLRSEKANTGYRSVTSPALTVSNFIDKTATPGKTWYYRVVALDGNGDFSMPANNRVFLPET